MILPVKIEKWYNSSTCRLALAHAGTLSKLGFYYQYFKSQFYECISLLQSGCNSNSRKGEEKLTPTIFIWSNKCCYL